MKKQEFTHIPKPTYIKVFAKTVNIPFLKDFPKRSSLSEILYHFLAMVRDGLGQFAMFWDTLGWFGMTVADDSSFKSKNQLKTTLSLPHKKHLSFRLYDLASKLISPYLFLTPKFNQQRAQTTSKN